MRSGCVGWLVACTVLALLAGMARGRAAENEPVSLERPEAFFSELNLSYPGLESVRAAVEREDWAAARAAYASFFRSREIAGPLIEHYGKTDRKPNTTRADRAVDLIITGYGTYQFKDEVQWRRAPMVTVCRVPHFPHLARAYVETGDEKYAKAMVRDIRSFSRAWSIEEAKPLGAPFIRGGKTIGDGNPWGYAIIGSRARRWLTCLNHLRRSPSLDDDTIVLAVRRLVEDMLWAAPQINKKRRAHNLWFAMLQYELAMAEALPEFKAAATWKKGACEGLKYYLNSAFYPDGACRELTMAYSVSVVQQVNGVLAVLAASPEYEPLRRIGRQATRFHIALVRPTDQRLPAYGDLNPVSSTKLLGAAEGYGIGWARHVLTAGREGEPPPFLSFPPKGEEAWGGLYAMRDGWRKEDWALFVDGGPWGTSHQHCDKLSIEVLAHGAQFIVDPGSNSYHDTDPKSFRVNMSYGFQHSTLTINGVDQGALPKEASRPLGNRWEPGEHVDIFEGEYDFRDVDVPVLHRRRIVFVKGSGWLVEDVLTGEGEVTVAQTFQCPPSVTPEIDGETVRLRSASGPVLHLVPLTGGWAPRIVEGEREFPGSSRKSHHTWTGWVDAGRGWCGRERSDKRATPSSTSPAPAVVYEGRCRLPYVRRIWLAPAPSREMDPAAVTMNGDVIVVPARGNRPEVRIKSVVETLDVIRGEE